jgi:hypothetical protein
MVDADVQRTPFVPGPEGQQPIRIALYKPNLIGLSLFVIGPSLFFFWLSAFALARPQAQPWWISAAFAAAGVGLLLYVTYQARVSVELRHWVIDYRGLFGRKRIEIKDVTSIRWGGGRGTVTPTIRTPETWIMISNRSFSHDDLRLIAD